MSEKRKDISELLKEYYNRPIELQKENQKLKKKIDKLQKENQQLKEDLFLEKSKLNDVLKCLLDFIPQNIHEVELKTKILNIIRGDNND